MLTIRRRALLCVIFGAHVLVFRLASVGDGQRRARKPADEPAILWLVDLSSVDEARPSTYSPAAPAIPIDRPLLEGGIATDDTVAPPATSGADASIDWDSQATRVAEAAARPPDERKEYRPLDRHPTGMGTPPPKSSLRNPGDSERYEGGVIIDWVSNRCYYSNQDAHVDAFGPALRLQRPICTGRPDGGGGQPFQSFEEWKKERDSR